MQNANPQQVAKRRGILHNIAHKHIINHLESHNNRGGGGAQRCLFGCVGHLSRRTPEATWVARVAEAARAFGRRYSCGGGRAPSIKPTSAENDVSLAPLVWRVNVKVAPVVRADCLCGHGRHHASDARPSGHFGERGLSAAAAEISLQGPHHG